jgi:S1-C subfamily serine protease
MFIRNHRFVSLLGVLLVACLAPSAKAEESIYNISAAAFISSVEIAAEVNHGMGVVLEGGHTIATCAHVVRDYKWVDVTKDGNTYKGYVIATDLSIDVAVIWTLANLKPFQYIDSVMTPLVNSSVIALGREGREPTIQMGVVLDIPETDTGRFNTSLPGGPGASGGPVLDMNANLVGIIKGGCPSAIKSECTTSVIPIGVVLKFIAETRRLVNR